jgi:ribosome recycling factor
VENLHVDYLGMPTPLKQIASISAPEARLLVIQPWDRSILSQVEKTLLRSELGLTPHNDGAIIRLPIPPLTEERRRDLVRVVHKRVVEGKVAVRNIRRDLLERLRAMEKSKELSQDENRRGQERLQKLTDGFIAQIEKLGQDKEAEVLEV